MESTTRYSKSIAQYFGRISILGVIFSLFCMSGCSPHVTKEENLLAYYPSESERQALEEYPDQLAPITHSSMWGKEWLMGREFAKEGDFYRALTCFRQARFLLQIDNALTPEREARLAWSEALSYAFSGKWEEVIAVWEKYRDHMTITDEVMKEQWIILLYGAYHHEKRGEEAEGLLPFLSQGTPAREKLSEWKYFSLLQPSSPLPPQMSPVEKTVREQMKSPTKAKIMNAVLPGLGYFYAGEKQTALTSLLLNTCFIGAGIQLLQVHQPFLAIITWSFEAGWYFGGMTGASLAVDQYNETLKKKLVQPYLCYQKAYPLLLVRVGW